jgi:hypothetical protein
MAGSFRNDPERRATEDQQLVSRSIATNQSMVLCFPLSKEWVTGDSLQNKRLQLMAAHG